MQTQSIRQRSWPGRFVRPRWQYWLEQLPEVVAVLFLGFNKGDLATGSDTDPILQDLIAEVTRLTRPLRALMPQDGEVAGLLASMLLIETPAAPLASRPAANWSHSTNRTERPETRRF